MPTKPVYPGTLNVARATSLGLLGAWLHNDAAGATVKDTSGNGNDGTLSGSYSWVLGNFDGAINFNGVTGQLNLGNPVILSPPLMSIVSWIKTAFIGSNKQICTKDSTATETERAWQFRKNTTDHIQFIVFKADEDYGVASGTSDIADNDWHQVVGTYDGANVKVYVDHVLEDTTPFVGTVQSQTNDVLVARSENPAPGFWEGRIDHNFIFNKGLSQAEIDTLFADPFWMYRAEVTKKVGVCRRPWLGTW